MRRMRGKDNPVIRVLKKKRGKERFAKQTSEDDVLMNSRKRPENRQHVK